MTTRHIRTTPVSLGDSPDWAMFLNCFVLEETPNLVLLNCTFENKEIGVAATGGGEFPFIIVVHGSDDDPRIEISFVEFADFQVMGYCVDKESIYVTLWRY